ncbi:methyl-accepting chemotaxis protein [Haloarcula halophila]|uniref:methyl-accepting chemotaxis protein n=1 Tax=Haloarcula TaxID=2237 RepID=UPI0023E41694|nr:methyl-accepting chemotaxis protein [Halomicroarcula sp. DFY41]
MPSSGKSSADRDTDVNDGMIANAQGAVSVVLTTSESVDDQLEGIQTAATTQVEEMDAVANDISKLSATIEEISSSAEEVNQTTNRAAEMANAGRSAADEATDAMETASDSTEQVQENVEALEQKVTQINEVVDMINQIAERTNMLALNASIEAARADEAGDGFAVVADEVKSLAEESQSRTEEIEATLTEIQDLTADVTEALDEAVTAVENGADRVQTTDEKLEFVSDEIQSAATGIDEVSMAVQEGAEAATRVAGVTDETADAAREISGSVDDIGDERADTTDLLNEIDDALSDAREGREARLSNADTVPTGIDEFDRMGGLPAGSRSVIAADTGDESVSTDVVDSAVATCCAAAIDAGWAASLSPTATLDRHTLDNALGARADVTLTDALAGNRLFVLDLFGSWNHDENVINVTEHGLDTANSRVDRRRDRPLFVIGNIAGELDLMGEEAVRENTYENDGDVLSDDDLVVNVIDEATVPEQLTSFYLGAADRSCRLDGTQQRQNGTRSTLGR